jgi:hypothetical protein
MDDIDASRDMKSTPSRSTLNAAASASYHVP